MAAEQLYVIHWQIMKSIKPAWEPVLRLWKKACLLLLFSYYNLNSFGQGETMNILQENTEV